jgi:hypothetical protein
VTEIKYTDAVFTEENGVKFKIEGDGGMFELSFIDTENPDMVFFKARVAGYRMQKIAAGVISKFNEALKREQQANCEHKNRWALGIHHCIDCGMDNLK